MMMRFVRCDSENQFFQSLIDQWKAQVAEDDIGPWEYFEPQIEHAKRIALEDPRDPNYGIFSVMSDEQEFEALVHINYAWPKEAVRVVWQLLAPKYHGREEEVFEVAPVIAALFRGAWDLYTGEWAAAKELKIYCPTSSDRFLFQSAASYLKLAGFSLQLERGGSWIHIARQ